MKAVQTKKPSAKIHMTSHKALVGEAGSDTLYMWETHDKRILTSRATGKLICADGFYFLGVGVYDANSRILVVGNDYYLILKEELPST